MADKTQLGNIAILNADKEDTEFISRILSGAGYEVVSGDIDATGVTDIQNKKPDLIILGVRSGDQSSNELVDIFTANGVNIPIMLMSTPEIITDSLSQKGIAGLLIKPVEGKRLLIHVKAILDIQKSLEPNAQSLSLAEEEEPLVEIIPMDSDEAIPFGLTEPLIYKREKREKPLVLVVDDEPDMQSLLTDLLDFSGFDVIAATDGVEGLSLAQQKLPDAILLDIMLPRLDGFQMCRLLKFNERYRNIPIIMVTARNQPKDKELATGSGADGYVTKPFDTKELVSEIRNAIDKYS
ncbi:MAG: response regulator [Pseudomonadota bacterium]